MIKSINTILGIFLLLSSGFTVGFITFKFHLFSNEPWVYLTTVILIVVQLALSLLFMRKVDGYLASIIKGLANRHFFIAISIVVCLAFPFILGIKLNEIYIDEVLEEKGIEIKATVSKIHKKVHGGRNGITMFMYCDFLYNNNSMTIRKAISAKDRIKEGDTIRVIISKTDSMIYKIVNKKN